MTKPNILIILGSTREGRNGEAVARWVAGLAALRQDFSSELVDLRDWPLPFLATAVPPGSPDYQPEGIVKQWSEKIAAADGFIIVTPEYNHGYPAVLKNALDHLYREWNNKPVAFVSYGGSAGGARSVEALRGVAIELQMAPVRNEVNIAAVWSAFDESGKPKDPGYEKKAAALFEQLAWWVNALLAARDESAR